MAIAKLIIKCEECGKDFEHRKTCYNRSDADSYEIWAKQNITTCPSCYAAAKRAEEAKKRAKEAERRDTIISEIGVELPALNGSEKQIAWAETIRKEKVVMCIDYVGGLENIKDVFWTAIKSVTDSGWWINNRSEGIRSFSAALAKEAGING